MQKCSDTGERVRSFVSNYKLYLSYQSWYLVLRTVHSHGISCNSNCSQHYAAGPATVALLPTCWHLVPSQLQTPWQCGHFLLTSAGFIKISSIHRVYSKSSIVQTSSECQCHYEVYVGVCLALDNTGFQSVRCPHSVDSRSTWHWTAFFVTGLGSFDWSLPFKSEVFFSALDQHITDLVG